MVRLWVLNTLPSHWEHCREGPQDANHHPYRHLGHPWHGVPEGGRAPDPSTLTPGEDLFLVRRTGGEGVAGIWTFEEARRVDDQAILPESWRDHEGEMRDYEWVIYCRGTPELELVPPMKEDFSGSFPFHHSKLTGTGIEMDDEGREAYVQALVDHGISNATRRRLEDALEATVEPSNRSADYEPPERTEYVTVRAVRDTKKSAMAKQLYDYRCQICGDHRQGRTGEPYAEAHHIKPLGKQHRGPDSPDNLLCLCANHHVDFDYGRIRVDPDTYELTHAFESDVDGTRLTIADGHELNAEFLEYHNEEIANF